MSPFKILYGRDPSSNVPYSIDHDTPQDVRSMLQRRNKLLLQLKFNLE